MATSSRTSGYHDAVDEPLLRTITAEIQAAIPGAEVRLFGSRARGTARPDSDLDLLVTVPATGSRSIYSCIRIRRYRIASNTGGMSWPRQTTTGESCMPAEGQPDAALMLRIAQRDLMAARSIHARW
jgi:predicted nucleotidyltransferase